MWRLIDSSIKNENLTGRDEYALEQRFAPMM